MKTKGEKILSAVLFGIGLGGIFVSEIMAVRDTVKAKDILERHPVARNHSATIVGFDERTYEPKFDNIVPKKKSVYYKEIAQTTWKAYIPTAISTAVTVGAIVGSKVIDIRTIGALSTAAASGLALVGRYREKIAEYSSPDILHEIDRDIAKEEIENAKPPVITTSGLLSTEQIDLSEDGEYLFFDPLTKIKFRASKLAVLGAKYYLNRNFSLGGSVPLSMFYAFLGVTLPEEWEFAGWDCAQMCDDGYYWIDIDIVRSHDLDPETGEEYYILEYGFDPGDVEDYYYPFGNPVDVEGSHAV